MSAWQTPLRVASTVAVLVVGAGWTGACGKKGPPLPPLVKLPSPPDNFTAVRRGDVVDLEFVVPSTNTDRTRPANVQRVEVYAFTGPTPATDADFLRRAAKVASVAVKAPRDPNQTTEPDELPEEAEEIEPPEGPGLDQGAVAHAAEQITQASLRVPEEPRSRGNRASPPTGSSLPASELPPTVPSRTYIGVGINKSGRKGATSRRVAVPLVPPPPPPTALVVTFDEHAVNLTWTPSPAVVSADKPPVEPAPSKSDAVTPMLGYNVYEVAQRSGLPRGVEPGARSVPQAPTSGAASSETKLTMAAVGEPQFSDPRMNWGSTRCYAVRAVESFGALFVESDGSAAACVTLVDSFPPATPQGLTGVASQGAISLIWEPNSEKDLDGYLVLRGPSVDQLTRLTPSIIHETTFRDAVPPGVRYVYAVQAVDTAGNVSPRSMPIEETAR